MTTEFFTRPKHDFTRLGRVDGWLGRTLRCNIVLTYRKTSSISRTKSQNLNVSCFLLQWSSPNPLKSGVKLRMKM